LSPKMGRSHNRAGEVVSRLASGLWLLAAFLVLQLGAPALGTAELRLSGSSSLGANAVRNERAHPRSAQPREQARSVAETRHATLKPDESDGSDQDAISIQRPGPLPSLAPTPPLAGLDDSHVPAIASYAFRARAPPSRA
jgi:hypothetical protein